MLERSKTMCQLEKCTFIMDKLLEWQKLEDATADSVRLVKDLGNELMSYMRELTENLKEHRKEAEKPKRPRM